VPTRLLPTRRYFSKPERQRQLGAFSCKLAGNGGAKRGAAHVLREASDPEAEFEIYRAQLIAAYFSAVEDA